MYCHGDLGDQKLIESFSAGRRLVFDPERGRLWVICPKCGRWNLVPLRARWEALRSCETLFRKTPTRFTRPGIGIAEVDGVDLVRVGPDLDDDLAAWRYGDEFKTRYRTARLIGSVQLALMGTFLVLTVLAAGLAMGLGGAITALVGIPLLAVVTAAIINPIVAKIPTRDGRWLEVRADDLTRFRLIPGEDDRAWSLRLPSGDELTGPIAYQAAALLLPIINRGGGDARAVELAARYQKRKGGTPEAVFAAAARRYGAGKTARLSALDPQIRLALEMSSHEESEREELEAELSVLERAWKEAEELAVVSDRLMLPERVTRALAALRGDSSKPDEHTPVADQPPESSSSRA